MPIRALFSKRYPTKQGCQVTCLDQTGFAAFGKSVQFITGDFYAEIEQLSKLTLLSDFATLLTKKEPKLWSRYLY